MENSLSATAAAALPQTHRGPKDWTRAAIRVTQRHRYPCNGEHPLCNHQQTHYHGVDCDYTCNCKGPQ